MSAAIDNSAIAVPAAAGAGARVNPIVRVLPSLTDVTVILTLVLLFALMAGTHTMLGDGDTGWHIRTGQWILANHKVPHHDLFTYTVPGNRWFAWEWLWDVAFAVIYNFSGLGGVVMASLTVLCLTMALLFRLVRRKCDNVLVAFGVTGTAVAGSTIHWLARPHLFTLLFAVIFFWTLERAKDFFDAGETRRAVRALAILPALVILWVNLHAGFVLGVTMAGCYAAGEAAAWLLFPEERKQRWARAWRYGLTAAGCLAASVVNPYTIELHKHMFTFLHGNFAQHISEYMSANFHSVIAWTWELMLLLGAVSVFREVMRRQFAYAFLYVLWGYLALLAGRNLPIFMILAAPVVAKNIAELLNLAEVAPIANWARSAASGLNRLAAEMGETDSLPRIHLVSVLALAFVAALIYAPKPPDGFKAEYDPKRYPAKALEFLGKPGIPNRIFTDDEWGDYLLYTMYPTKVFVDGRSDMYGDQFCMNYLDIMGVKYDWEQSLAQYGVDTVVLTTTSSLAGTLKESHRWQVVYDDHLAIVFRHVGAAPRPGEKVSALQPEGGTGRDRRITKSEDRVSTIKKTTT